MPFGMDPTTMNPQIGDLMRMLGVAAPPPGPPMSKYEGAFPYRMQRGQAMHEMPPQQQMQMQQLMQQTPPNPQQPGIEQDPYYQMLRQIHSQLPKTTREYFRYNDPGVQEFPNSLLDFIYGGQQ